MSVARHAKGAGLRPSLMPNRFLTRLFVGLLVVAGSYAANRPAWAQEYEIAAPPVMLTHVPLDITVNTAAAAGTPALLQMRVGGSTFDAERLDAGGTIAATEGRQVDLPQGSVLRVRIDSSLHINTTR